jgi:hypothetical protein
LNFEHKHAAHCETGVVSALLSHYGLRLSEPMAFGLASGIAFAYIPFVKIANMPLIAYRMPPKRIISGIQKILGVKFETKKYKNEADATKELDAFVANNQVVGLQTSVFYLPYFPQDMRFHFNAHNILVYGKENGEYLISDPVFDMPVRCDEASLNRARFAKGIFEPKGFLYRPVVVPQNIDLVPAITKAIKKTVRSMLKAPIPVIGVRGMKYLAKKIEALEGKDKRYIKNILAHIVRMQEEIGTGGGGFRFMYAAFLKEAATLHPKKELLNEASTLMTEAGDKLREFALLCAKACKKIDEVDLVVIANALREAAIIEEAAYKKLSAI